MEVSPNRRHLSREERSLTMQVAEPAGERGGSGPVARPRAPGRTRGSLAAWLARWDGGKEVVRARLLSSMLEAHAGESVAELEVALGPGGASLVLARLGAWLRVTYLSRTCLLLQLRVLSLFLCASGGRQLVLEFAECGGTSALLEIIANSSKGGEAECAVALEVLLATCTSTGRMLKELLCQSHGVRIVAECLARMEGETSRKAARLLLEALAFGNPKYQCHVTYALIALLSCRAAHAKHAALQTLRTIQPLVKNAHPILMKPLLQVLSSPHLDVQYEAIALITELMESPLHSNLLSGLLALLKPGPLDQDQSASAILHDPATPRLPEPLPVYVQQAAAAKAISALCAASQQWASELVDLGAAHYLLVAMGNQHYVHSRWQAMKTLKMLLQVCPEMEDPVKTSMGEALYASFLHNMDTLSVNMDAVQADILSSNKLRSQPLGS
ncbi:unnamed protein product [Lampetra planeri]